MLRSGRWPLAAAWLVTIGALSASSRGQTPAAPARTDEELAAARLLFAQALKDEQDARYELALDEFRRVRDVRDTAPVEYRIATCLEGLSRFTEALSAYGEAIRLAGADATAPTSAEIAAGSRERVDALSKRVAHLQLALSDHAPAGAQIHVDGKP
ncbi:MAG TPA: hypothetical protein VHS09_01320, partial [Polyangiaceae bacterium]|nr:hypothetical protein [Polyangiaceae bacterium]